MKKHARQHEERHERARERPLGPDAARGGNATDKALTTTPGERIRAAREAKGLTQAQLAELCGWSTASSSGQSRVGNYEADIREPSRADYLRLGIALETDPGELQFGTASVTFAKQKLSEAAEPFMRVPLIPWTAVGKKLKEAPFAVREATDWYPLPAKAGPRTFALRVQGVSMEPRYREGEIIFVDPDAQVRAGSRVVAIAPGAKDVVFRELVREGDRVLLKALNPAWPESMIEIQQSAVCGVIVGKWVPE